MCKVDSATVFVVVLVTVVGCECDRSWLGNNMSQESLVNLEAREVSGYRLRKRSGKDNFKDPNFIYALNDSAELPRDRSSSWSSGTIDSANKKIKVSKKLNVSCQNIAVAIDNKSKQLSVSELWKVNQQKLSDNRLKLFLKANNESPQGSSENLFRVQTIGDLTHPECNPCVNSSSVQSEISIDDSFETVGEGYITSENEVRDKEKDCEVQVDDTSKKELRPNVALNSQLEGNSDQNPAAEGYNSKT